MVENLTPLLPVLVHRLAERVYVQILEDKGVALAVPEGGGVYVGDVTKITIHVEGKADTEGWLAHTEQGGQAGVDRTRVGAMRQLLAAHGMRMVDSTETIPALF